MVPYIPPQVSENISDALEDFSNTLHENKVPLWKVVVGGLVLILMFPLTFILIYEFMMMVL